MSSVQRKPPRGKFNFPHKHLDLRRRRRQLKCKYSSRLGASRAQGLVIANTADYRLCALLYKTKLLDVVAYGLFPYICKLAGSKRSTCSTSLDFSLPLEFVPLSYYLLDAAQASIPGKSLQCTCELKQVPTGSELLSTSTTATMDCCGHRRIAFLSTTLPFKYNIMTNHRAQQILRASAVEQNAQCVKSRLQVRAMCFEIKNDQLHALMQICFSRRYTRRARCTPNSPVNRITSAKYKIESLFLFLRV
uniref:Uncharacterized protein n=1 Tax=Trichogramma kaykai TaxID=54128 RepID=A0ABD2VZW4_9HYME